MFRHFSGFDDDEVEPPEYSPSSRVYRTRSFLFLFLSSLARFLIFSLSFSLDTALASVTNICAAADAIMFADAGLELFFFVSSQH